jgi:hypothetical protein
MKRRASSSPLPREAKRSRHDDDDKDDDGPDWAALLPEILMRVAHFYVPALVEIPSDGLPLARPAEYSLFTRDADTPSLVGDMFRLGQMARTCKSWFNKINWYHVCLALLTRKFEADVDRLRFAVITTKRWHSRQDLFTLASLACHSNTVTNTLFRRVPMPRTTPRASFLPGKGPGCADHDHGTDCLLPAYHGCRLRYDS